MNEWMIHVERAVRPAKVGARTKAKAREEMLVHLTAIHDEEAKRHADPAAARAAALSRFGDPATLTKELENNRRRGEYWEWLGDRWFFWAPGESTVRHSFRIFLAIAVFTLPCHFAILAPELLAGHGFDPRTFAAGLVYLAMAFPLIWLFSEVRKSVHGFGRSRSLLRAGFLSIAFGAVCWGGSMGFAATMGGDLVFGWNLVKPNWFPAVFASALVIILFAGWKTKNEVRRYEWAALDIA